MARKRDTGKGTDYNAAEAEALAARIIDAYEAWDRESGGGDSEEPSQADVRAVVEWAGHVMPKNDGKRRVRVDLPAGGMRKVRKAAEKLEAARGKLETAKPSKSYKAKSWHAQLSDLTKTERGSKAADRAGLNPTRQTLTKWLSDPDYPIRRGDREKIEKAYAELRNAPVTEAREAEQGSAKAVADAMTDALSNKYGQNVRFRDIESFKFD
jgi:hypothetical protein